MLASGPNTVERYYCPVGSGDLSRLPHTKRDILRKSDFDKAALNYPTYRTFGLVDCFMFISETWCGFQITWQKTHPFNLRTLLDFRERLGVGIQDAVNIYFVNPIHVVKYKERIKIDYLVQGESPQEHFVDQNGNVLLEASDVLQMWENTHFRVAFPKDNKWRDAVRSCMASLSSGDVTGKRYRAMD